MQFRLTGLIAAAFTAFDENGTLNLDAIEAHAALLIRNGVSGAVGAVDAVLLLSHPRADGTALRYASFSATRFEAHPDVCRTQVH